MKTVLISGANGQLMTDVVKQFNKNENIKSISRSRSELNVVDKDSLKRHFDMYEPDVYIHGASSHVVDKIHEDPKEAAEVNIAALYEAIKLCNERGVVLVNISTNYVYGNNNRNFLSVSNDGFEENSPANPCNIYGAMKYTGELLVQNTCKAGFNFRVAGLFGQVGSRAKNGDNFIYIVLRNLEDHEFKSFTVVDDQYMNITYTVDAAKAIEKILMDDRYLYGTYNVVNSGITTWYEVANFIKDCTNFETEIIPCTTEEKFGSAVGRVKYSALSLKKVKDYFDIEMPKWQSAVVRFLKEIGQI